MELIPNLFISIHAPAWGATVGVSGGGILDIDFNPRSRVGSDMSTSFLPSKEGYFNPRSRVGSDLSCSETILSRYNFNPRSRVGSDDTGEDEPVTKIVFQSTLPRGERLDNDPRLKGRIKISIHAPAWGATDGGNHVVWFGLFQSTLPRGERLRHYILVAGEAYDFNPRSRVGSDRSSPCTAFTVSTFQSTLPRGERHHLLIMSIGQIVFQSTLPRGERLGRVRSPFLLMEISIHAPAWGATG